MANSTHRYSMLIATTLLLSMLACESEKPQEVKIIRPVRYVVVANSSTALAKSFAGSVTARTKSALSFKVSGTLEKRSVKIGDKVTKGQLLAEILNTDYLLEMEKAKAAYLKSKAEQRNARTNLRRALQLYENNSISPTELDTTRTTADSTRAARISAFKQYQLAKLQVSYTKLKSPGNCAVVSTNKNVNENFNAGELVVNLNCGIRTKIRVYVPESDINRISTGDPVNIKFDSISTTPFAGKVIEVGISTVDNSATFPVAVILNKQLARVKPGMIADVEFQFKAIKTKSELISLPMSAIGKDMKGHYVYVVLKSNDQFGTVKRKNVNIGKLVGNNIVILKGLELGDKVITAGISRISVGLKVRLRKH